MPKPTVQNHPKPEPKTSPAAKKGVQTTRAATGKDCWDRAEVMAEVLPLLESGLSLNKACAKIVDGPAPHSVLRWVRDDPALAEQYARSRELGFALLGDEILDIADEHIPVTDSGATDSGAVAHQRLRIDTRKWQLSKMLPKLYGDKVTQEHVGKDGGPIQTAQLDLRGLSEAELEQMQLLLSKAGAK